MPGTSQSKSNESFSTETYEIQSSGSYVSRTSVSQSKEASEPGTRREDDNISINGLHGDFEDDGNNDS